MNYVQAWQRSGRGVPGAVALKLAHDRYESPGQGLGPAIRLAEEGFTVTAKMAGA